MRLFRKPELLQLQIMDQALTEDRDSLEDAKRQFCSDVALLKHRAMQLGLYRTMHRLDDAVRMVGFEVAGTPELCDKIEADRAARLERMGSSTFSRTTVRTRRGP